MGAGLEDVCAVSLREWIGISAILVGYFAGWASFYVFARLVWVFSGFLQFCHGGVLMKSKSSDESDSYSGMDYKYHEVIAQEYSNCKLSGGFVEGHPIDTMYIQLEKDNIVTTSLLLRPDEVAALAWIASGVLWSEHIKSV